LPADDDSRDGDYEYETLSQYSSENDEWGSEQEWDRVTRRYEEVEELLHRYCRGRSTIEVGRTKVEYLLKLEAILDTGKRAFVFAVEVYEEGIGRDFEDLGRDFMDIKKSVMSWYGEGWSVYLGMGEVGEGNACKEMKELHALSMGRVLQPGS